jgi:hypothetical protein
MQSSPQSLFDIAARILGLFFVITAASSVPTIGAVLDSISQVAEDPLPAQILWISVSVGVSAIAGMALIIFGGRLVRLPNYAGEAESSQVTDIPTVVIQLMGLFLVVGAVRQLLTALFSWVWSGNDFAFNVAQVAPAGVEFGLSVFLIIRAGLVAKWLKSFRDPGT